MKLFVVLSLCVVLFSSQASAFQDTVPRGSMASAIYGSNGSLSPADNGRERDTSGDHMRNGAPRSEGRQIYEADSRQDVSDGLRPSDSSGKKSFCAPHRSPIYCD